MTASTACYCIGVCVGFILARFLRLVRVWFVTRDLADGDEVLCEDATVFRERTGEIAWIDNEKPPEHYGGDTVT